MAVHGGLRGTVTGVQPKPGMLVSLRSVEFARDYVEDLPGDLRVEAECLQADAASLQYSFRVTHGESCWRKGGRRSCSRRSKGDEEARASRAEPDLQP